MIGSSYEEQGRDQEAIAALQKTLVDYPEGEYASKVEAYLAWIYYNKLKDVAKAIEIYQGIANNTRYDHDTRKEAQYLIGEMYKLQGDNARAIEAYKKLLVEFPKPMSKPDHPADKVDKSYILDLQQKTPVQPESST
jgi:tetratricopeptide (TPR) repeat protein